LQTKVLLTHCYPTPDEPTTALFVRDWHSKYFGGDDFTLLHYPFGGNMLYSKNVFKLLRYVYRASKGIRSVDQHATVYSHWWIPLGWLAARSKAQVEVICHGSDVYWLRKHRLFAKLLAKYARRVRHWTFVSQDLKSELQKLYPFIPDSITAVEHMPVNSKIFERECPHKTKDTFVTCGALIRRKNVDLALWYIKNEDQRTGTRHRLYVIGEGSLRGDLERLAHNLQVDAVFTGTLSPEQVADTFCRCEKFLLFSDDEGYGQVIDEAKLCGCQTIVTAGDGKQEHADVVLPRPNRRKLTRILSKYYPWAELSDDKPGGSDR